MDWLAGVVGLPDVLNQFPVEIAGRHEDVAREDVSLDLRGLEPDLVDSRAVSRHCAHRDTLARLEPSRRCPCLARREGVGDEVRILLSGLRSDHVVQKAQEFGFRVAGGRTDCHAGFLSR